MTSVHLATAIAIRDDRILLVASRYPNHAEPLWNLPGGRVHPGELFEEAAVRELHEETGYAATSCEFAYVSESYDDDVHFVSVAFSITVSGEMRAPLDDHVVEVVWCPLEDLAQRLNVAVVREPLLQHLASRARYFARHDAGITIRWSD